MCSERRVPQNVEKRWEAEAAGFARLRAPDVHRASAADRHPSRVTVHLPELRGQVRRHRDRDAEGESFTIE